MFTPFQEQIETQVLPGGSGFMLDFMGEGLQLEYMDENFVQYTVSKETRKNN